VLTSREVEAYITAIGRAARFGAMARLRSSSLIKVTGHPIKKSEAGCFGGFPDRPEGGTGWFRAV
jgi:hypothetical protein